MWAYIYARGSKRVNIGSQIWQSLDNVAINIPYLLISCTNLNLQYHLNTVSLFCLLDC